jgi:peptidoglycan/LPS O-acetylase OafA/YrhL
MKLHFLQSLRAIAAWLVILDHAILEVIPSGRSETMAQIAWTLGDIGVYLFFTISGFIMVQISWNKFASPHASAQFLRRRIVRIVPLYWLATFLALAYHRVSVTHGENASWPELIQSLAFIPYLDEAMQWRPILPQGWTLSYEMMFYVIFAFALAYSRRIGLMLMVATLVALSGFGLLLPSGIARHLASPIVLWFAFGIATGACWRHMMLTEPDWLARRAKLLEPFGDASYSTYLVHGFVLTVLFRLWTRLVGEPSFWLLPVGLIAATIAGQTVYFLVEQPMLRLSSNYAKATS